jgi:class 3 adenylate cyclase
MKAIVERHGGTVERFIGDAVMAVRFPPCTKDDALRAAQRRRGCATPSPALGV